ncbi:MAG: helix-turn-helix domain-containing protein [Coriobacteriales bacterium]|jgi:sugar diacid utilization regulator|nr:helix-turn-helix domain-containing protein [Coriobacteriales bacterium]
MALTLHILAHELERVGIVACEPVVGASSFEDARLFVDKDVNPRFLYLTDDPDIPEQHSSKRLSFLYVGDYGQPTPPAASAVVFTNIGLLEVLRLLQDVFLTYGTWERTMDASIIADEGLQKLFDLSTRFLRNNVIVCDPALKLLAYTKDIPCDDPITTNLIRSGYHTKENIQLFRRYRRPEVWERQSGLVINDSKAYCKYTTAVYSFKANRTFSLVIVMMCNVVEPEEYLLDTFMLFLNRVGHYAKRDFLSDPKTSPAKDVFLIDLIENRIRGEEVIKDRSQLLGIPYEGRFCLYYMDTSQLHIPRGRLLSDIALRVNEVHVLSLGDALIAICFNCGKKRQLACDRSLHPTATGSVASRINEVLVENEISGGRSIGYPNLGSLCCTFLQAREAAAMSSGMTPSPFHRPDTRFRNIIDFDEYYLDFLIGRGVIEGEDLLRKTQWDAILSEIWRYDEKNRTNNYWFLYHYLLCERRPTEVADVLHMHRNNVKYRIERIEEEFGIDTSDPILRFNLLLAYRILGGELLAKQQQLKPASEGLLGA